MLTTSGFFTIGEDKMVLLELLDIDIFYHMTVLSPKHSPQSPLKSNTTSCFQNIVQEIKNQLPPPSPTSPINYCCTWVGNLSQFWTEMTQFWTETGLQHSWLSSGLSWLSSGLRQ